MKTHTKKAKNNNKLSIQDIDLEMLKEYVINGPGGDLPEPYNSYLEILDKIRGMHMRIDKYGNPEQVIQHLVKYEKLDRLKARHMYEEALDYFYADSHISKQAWANILANRMEMMLNFVLQTVKDSADAKRAVEIAKEIGAMRQVHVADKEELPEELFSRPVKIYTADPEDLGLPRANRLKLKELIGKLPDLTEKEKARLFQEADIDGLFKAFPDEQEDPRKS